MLIQGFPLTAKLFDGRQNRFWYWRGASGRKYIHSVYSWRDCPPLPGAVYVAVKRVGQLRTALAVSRFPGIWDEAFQAFQDLDADEVHIHLLAKDNVDAERILSDLAQELRDDSHHIKKSQIAA